ncbi:MAG TPA: SDR family NAD(P)-dependent oxidoreductase [Nevskiaceae bacterium]|nr:SDR family NAD(P)-dependent oxidoreductase [Nevskiaceae bacterium]
MSKQPVCAVVGAGPGNGAAFGRRFAAAGYRVALLARDASSLEQIAKDVPGAVAIPVDVRDAASVQAAFSHMRAEPGDPDVLIYNAGAGKFGNVDQLEAADFESAWRTNALGCFLAVKEVLPAMRRRGGGSIVAIGATASIKGSANFAGFASAKAALRSLAQSLARQLGPENIHVAHVVIDGVIDLERTRRMLADRPDDFFLKPDDIATSVFNLATQPRSAWTFELDLRPFGEKW